MPEWIKYIIIFFALFFTDIVWTLYIRWAAAGLALKAAIMSVFIYIIGAYTFLELVKDPYIMFPAAFGCLIGTYFTIRWDIKHEKNKVHDSSE